MSQVASLGPSVLIYIMGVKTPTGMRDVSKMAGEMAAKPQSQHSKVAGDKDAPLKKA